MSVIVTLLDILCTANESFWLACLIDSFFEKRRLDSWDESTLKKHREIFILMAVHFASVFVLNRIELTSTYTFLISILIATILSCFMWRCDIIETLSVSGTYGLGILVLNIGQIMILGAVGGEKLIKSAAYETSGARLFVMISAFIVWFGVNYLVQKRIRNSDLKENRFKHLAIVSTCACLGLLFLFEQSLSSFNIEMNLVLFLSVLISVMCMVMIYFFSRYKIMNEEIRMMEKQNEMLMKSYSAAEEFYLLNGRLYHDMKNHFQVLGYMLDNNRNKEARNYLESVITPIKDYLKKDFTGIDIIDVILSEKEKLAEKKGVRFSYSVAYFNDDIRIEKKDLCVIFANLMDNAIEASRREIRVEIKPINDMLMIKIMNDYDEEKRINVSELQSTKKDSFHHGWGIKSVRSVVEKYEGTLDISVNKGFFCVEVIINRM